MARLPGSDALDRRNRRQASLPGREPARRILRQRAMPATRHRPGRCRSIVRARLALEELAAVNVRCPIVPAAGVPDLRSLATVMSRMSRRAHRQHSGRRGAGERTNCSACAVDRRSLCMANDYREVIGRRVRRSTRWHSADVYYLPARPRIRGALLAGFVDTLIPRCMDPARESGKPRDTGRKPGRSRYWRFHEEKIDVDQRTRRECAARVSVLAAGRAGVHAEDVEPARRADSGLRVAGRDAVAPEAAAMPFPNPAMMFAALDPPRSTARSASFASSRTGCR